MARLMPRRVRCKTNVGHICTVYRTVTEKTSPPPQQCSQMLYRTPTDKENCSLNGKAHAETLCMIYNISRIYVLVQIREKQSVLRMSGIPIAYLKTELNVAA